MSGSISADYADYTTSEDKPQRGAPAGKEYGYADGLSATFAERHITSVFGLPFRRSLAAAFTRLARRVFRPALQRWDGATLIIFSALQRAFPICFSCRLRL
jgi:hypothetical protein